MKSPSVRPTLALAVLLLLTGLFLFFDQTVQAQPDSQLRVMGGGGGSPFVARCPQDQHLAGFRLRAGDDIDAIRPICAAYIAETETYTYYFWGQATQRERQKYAAGPPVPHASMFGGPGGREVDLLCPSEKPLVTGMRIEIEGRNTQTINSIQLFCWGGEGGIGIDSETFPLAEFRAPELVSIIPSVRPGFAKDVQHCPGAVKKAYVNGGTIYDSRSGTFVKGSSGYQPDPEPGLVAVGISGRSGKWLDAVGLICSDLKLTIQKAAPPETRVRAQGRVRGDPGAARREPLSICAAARGARARNSPAAPGLEAQCRAAGAAGEIAPVRAQTRVGPDPGATPSTPKPLCEAARMARERNSPAAPGLEAQCRTITKGEQIANMDPLALELRDQQPDVRAQDGFYVGMAIAEGHTSPGPGKDKICASMSSVAGQGGCRIAVLFSVERNKNPSLAATGAQIALADPDVAAARDAETDVFYRLGFDIASGIYGDPALGADANIAPGPIRDSLSAAGRIGFNASLKFHLGRSYKR